MKKVFIQFIALMLLCSLSAADEYDEYILPGPWHIKGQGFGERVPIRLQLNLTGNMNITTSALKDISNDTYIRSGDQTVNINQLDEDMKALTGYDLYMRLNLTGAGFKAWDEQFPNGIRVPVLLPNMRPTVNDPFELPPVTVDDITYRVTFTSPTQGKVRINGYTDVDVVGTCEINADCAIWRDGYPEPELESETDSGCNAGAGIYALSVLLLGVRRIVRN